MAASVRFMPCTSTAVVQRHRVRRHDARTIASDFFRIGVVLASSCSLGECAMSNSNDRSSAKSQDKDLQSVSDISPSAIHWTIAIILGLALVGGLVRVVRILAKDDSIV